MTYGTTNGDNVGICCPDPKNCGTTGWGDWTCSSIYNDATYAKTVCPNVQSVCGANDINQATVTDTNTISIKGLDEGKTCFYKIK